MNKKPPILATALALIAAPAAEVGAAALEDPPCDDPEVVEFVIDAFDAVQEFESHSRVALDELTDIRDLGITLYADGSWRQIRACAARATLASGRAIASWHQIRLPLIADAIGYRVKVCFEEHDPVSRGDCAAFDRKPE